MKRTPVTLLTAVVSTLSLAVFADPQNTNVTEGLPPRASLAPPVDSGEGVVVAARDARRGLPSFAWATQPRVPTFAVPAGSAALWHLDRLRAAYRLSTAALSTASVTHVHDTGRGGIIVTLRQSVGGIELMHADAKVLMRANHELVAISGALHPRATPTAARPFKRSATAAIATAVGELTGAAVNAGHLGKTQPRGGYARFELHGPHAFIFTAPARAKRVYFPIADRLVPAYYVETYLERGTQLIDYAYVISADTGDVLYRKNLTANDSYDYRVWADASAPHTPYDGPHENYTPHPTGLPDGQLPADVPSVVITMEGFNTNPNNASDPWLPSGATESRGNNVNAYVDRDAPDGFNGTDIRALVQSGALDYSYDLNLDPRANDDQSMAVVTQLFYVTNWLHDWFYDSGFDEAAGNAQDDNFGRGGEENDAMRAEAQDYSGTNNANMQTPADGQAPRMQMYTWNGPTDRSLDIAPLNLAPDTDDASFGPQSFDVTASLVAVDDGTDTVTDGCEAITNDVTGAIAFADRGNCSFWEKAANAQDAGAVGLIIANNQGSGPMGMGGTPGVPITIPLLSVSQADGDSIDAALASQAQTAHMYRLTGADRDSSLDNGIIAHEWGHFIHNRLAEGSNQAHRAMGEGWGDFLALYMLYSEGEDPSGTYAVASYSGAAQTNAGYFGIRRFPYSIDPDKNVLSFRHIAAGEQLPTTTPSGSGPANNAEVHNAGEIWASMMWEGYMALIDRTLGANPAYDFEAAQRRMADYVVAGMQLIPPEPTWNEARNAILAAAHAADPVDAVVMAEAFAARGLGTCAVSPDRFSTDFVGLTESFELASDGSIALSTLDDSVKSCDQDGFLDGGEDGLLTVRIANSGFADLDGASVSVSAVGPTGITVGNAMTVPTVGTFDEQVVQIPVSYEDDGLVERAELELTVTLTAPDSCVSPVEEKVIAIVHADEALAVSATATVDTLAQVWDVTGENADQIWARERVAPFDNLWHGDDFASPSDTAIVTPDLVVDPTAAFTIDILHAYSFEGTPQTWWDGGVIEITRDDGASWEDVSDYVDPGYDGVISDQAGSVLANRMAFSGDSDNYPDLEALSLDLGQNFAGETVRVRFRIATDQAVGGDGWYIDQIAFGGITNTPFPLQTEDDAICNLTPTADAGPDQEVLVGEFVTLSASASSDPEDDPLTFSWTQTGGVEDVALDEPTQAVTSFTAPDVADATIFTFEVAVSDGNSSATDDVEILVTPYPSDDGPGVGGSGPTGSGGAGANMGDDAPFELSGGACGCVVPGGKTSPRLGWLALLGLLGLARRRRSSAG